MTQVVMMLSVLLSTYLGEEGTDSALNQAPTDGALAQRGGALLTHHQVSTGDEDDVDLLVHTHLTGSLFLQPSQLLLHGQV